MLDAMSVSHCDYKWDGPIIDVNAFLGENYTFFFT